jgi:hypothetical protein
MQNEPTTQRMPPLPSRLVLLLVLLVLPTSCAWYHGYDIASEKALTSPSSLPKLLEGAKSGCPTFRMMDIRVARAVARFGKIAVPQLSEIALNGKHTAGRICAVKTLALLGKDAAADAGKLAASLAEQEGEVRVELGRALAADTLLSCTVAAFGNTCTISCGLIPLEKEATEGGGVAEFNCTAEKFKSALDALADSLSDE